MMQHVEEAGVHSGDSACVIPPMSLGAEMLAEIRDTTRRIAHELGVIGLINIQYAVARGKLYVIEANPRASRTVPFVSKAIGAPLAKIACRLMLGESLEDIRARRHVSVKEAVLPFARFAGADSVLGPEMKSTGEVMGVAATSRRPSARPSRRPVSRCPCRGPSSSRSPITTRRRQHSSPRASTTSASK